MSLPHKTNRQQPPQKAAATAPGKGQRKVVAGLCLVLAAITFAVFGQTLNHEFINLDDSDYVFENPMVVQGLTGKGIVWAFTHVHSANWHPLTWLSHELDCQLYGLKPGGHHLTNVLLHTASVIALFLVLRLMTGALWRSAFVAAVFAIHPLRVESVAWVSERKDVLSGLFFILTLGAYVRYAPRPWSIARYGLVLLLFAMGLMSKPMLVTLPLVLLLLDFWPLQRFESQKLSQLVLEKLPLLALSAGACVVTLLAQNGAIHSGGAFSLPYRLGNALLSCMIYLGQLVYPAGLAPFYPFYPNSKLVWDVALAVILMAGISILAVRLRRTQPWILVGWLWYLTMLLPVVGIIQVGDQAHADRYTYLPQIGLCVALTWLAAEWGAKCHLSRVVFGSLITGVLAVLLVCGWKQTSYWRDSETLWTHALACTTDNAMARFSLGSAFGQKGKADEAITQYQTALQMQPDYGEAHNNLGMILLQKGRVDEAIGHFQQAVQLGTNSAGPLINLGNAFFQKGTMDEAIAQYEKALKIRPDDAIGHNGLGNALLQKGNVDEAAAQYDKALEINSGYADAYYGQGNVFRQKGNLNEAIAHYQKALQLKPDYVECRLNLGNILLQIGRTDEAITHFQQALQLKPDSAVAHFNFANALRQNGKLDEAIVQYQTALQIDPRYAEAHINLGTAFGQKGQAAEAINQFQQTLQIKPTDIEAQNNLAWTLATCAEALLRNGEKAVQLARQANEQAGAENPIILHTLAAALAEAGRYSEAVETAQRALNLAEAQSNSRLTGQLQAQLKLYQAGKPFHSSAQLH